MAYRGNSWNTFYRMLANQASRTDTFAFLCKQGCWLARWHMLIHTGSHFQTLAHLLSVLPMGVLRSLGVYSAAGLVKC
ncbi:unnamed protein product [Closterium sp. Yama58-4]|nr:unnamed protein product [Closterium sp. Yama58-4]